MSLGSTFRQIIESIPEDQQKEYKKRVMTRVIEQFSETVRKQEHNILNGIGDLIEQLNNLSDSISEEWHIMKQAALKIDELGTYIVYSENKSAIKIYRLEEQLKTKQAYVEYLQKRLDDSGVGFVKE